MSTIEGVFAINKPPTISSAQVLRDLQGYFNPSRLFAPWISRERASRASKTKTQRRRRRDQSLNVKLGHGGTLDPLATGVLIVGVGSGTKALPSFLGCAKTYETVVLFGASSDTYDTEGKVVARASYEHITKEVVQEALERFKGKIMQIPPLWSAIRVEGKHMYEYAREGKEPPRKLLERPMETTEVTLLEWLPGGTHRWQWPKEEAPKEGKEAAVKLLHAQNGNVGQKRDAKDESDNNIPAKKIKRNERNAAEEQSVKEVPSEAPSSLSVGDSPCPAPAARIRLTVSSGFYVRSFAHDLGQAVGSLALMASLVRSKQGDFELHKAVSGNSVEESLAEAQKEIPANEKSNVMEGGEKIGVLEYADLVKGEECWGPKVEGLLKTWNDIGRRAKEDIRPQPIRNTSSPESG